MATYNWSNLSDYDFELVCRDVMAAIISHRVESFARGRDGGIDLRYASGRTLIIGQAKHYLKSTYSDLLKAVKLEKAKLDEQTHKPTRYLLFTTQALTPTRKRELKDLLTPYCKRASDVYGIGSFYELTGKP